MKVETFLAASDDEGCFSCDMLPRWRQATLRASNNEDCDVRYLFALEDN